MEAAKKGNRGGAVHPPLQRPSGEQVLDKSM
jgi:hypothetical protein